MDDEKFNHNNDRQKNIIRVVILTRSGKNKGACVSGYDLNTHQFVRFVCDGEAASAVPFIEINGISVFDIVDAEIIEACPVGSQSENVLVKHNGIKRIIRYSGTIEDIRKSIRYPERISFMDSTDNRLFDVSKFHHSLEIISVQNLVLTKYRKYNESITTRATFQYNGKIYSDFRVTDFAFDMRKIEEDIIRIPFADLILSIPKDEFIYQGENKGFYKFVAAIYPIEKPDIIQISGGKQAKAMNEKSCGRQNIRNKVIGSREQSYESWSEYEDADLLKSYQERMSIHEIAVKHKRSDDAIISRLKNLGKEI